MTDKNTSQPTDKESRVSAKPGKRRLTTEDANEDTEARKSLRFYMRAKIAVLAEDYLELEITNLRRLVEQVELSTLRASNTSEIMRCMQQINKIRERLTRTLEPETLTCESEEERDRVRACLAKLRELFSQVNLNGDFHRAVKLPLYHPSMVCVPAHKKMNTQ
jgi:hypothetical protein